MKVDDFDIFFELNDIPELKNRHDYEFYTRAEQSAIIKRFRSRFDPEGSKYTNGRLLLIAGSRKYPGAALWPQVPVSIAAWALRRSPRRAAWPFCTGSAC